MFPLFMCFVLCVQIRERESGITMEMSPILDMFAMLEMYLPEGYIPQNELDEKSMLKVNV